MTSKENKTKPEITYPAKWGFKIIGRDKNKLLAAIKKVMGSREHHCHPGNLSRTGKFHSYNASCEVGSRSERDRLFKAFQDHEDVDIVI